MSKKKINEAQVTDATVVEEANDQPMPQPVTMNYEQHYKLTDTFVEHLRISLKDVMCDRATPYYNYALAHKDDISQSDLNEFIRKIESSFTFGAVGDLMRNIGTQEGQNAYFTPIERSGEEQHDGE